MLKNIVKSTAFIGILVGTVSATEITVKIVNNMGYSHFTPLLVTAHNRKHTLFSLGTPSSEALQKMAEGGDISELEGDLHAIGANVSSNPAGGLLAPGGNTVTRLSTNRKNNSLSIVAMILPTNDGFIALNNWKIPRKNGIYRVTLNAYDAGTEANNEVVNGGAEVGVLGIPADPGANAGTGGIGIPSESEGFVHIHRGIVGDMNATGGYSDLDSTRHRWLNPVATAIITVKKTRKHRKHKKYRKY